MKATRQPCACRAATPQPWAALPSRSWARLPLHPSGLWVLRVLNCPGQLLPLQQVCSHSSKSHPQPPPQPATPPPPPGGGRQVAPQRGAAQRAERGGHRAAGRNGVAAGSVRECAAARLRRCSAVEALRFVHCIGCTMVSNSPSSFPDCFGAQDAVSMKRSGSKAWQLVAT